MKKIFPWHIPTPVQKSDFQSLFPKHQDLNIESDLASLPAFGVADDVSGPAAAADLQTNPDINMDQRLGSGRSVFYRGHYLKGIGRNLLTGNWSNPEDAYHNSGHLLTSAAVREYIVSLWLKEHGKAGAIVACEGILIRKMDSSFARQFQKRAFPKTRNGIMLLAPIDQVTQAISVKKADFCRFSNIWWMLGHPNHRTVETFFQSLDLFLPGTKGRQDPLALAKRFERALLDGLRNFFSFLELGVFWGSLHNNFCIDGRFLDLEVPSLLGGSFFGFLSTHPKKFQGNALPSFLEVVEYRRQVQTWLRLLPAKLEELQLLTRTCSPQDRQRLQAFCKAWNRVFHAKHLLWDDARFLKIYSKEVSKIFRFSKSQTRSVEQLVKMSLNPRLQVKEKFTLEPMGFSLYASEPATTLTPWVIAELSSASEKQSLKAWALKSLIEEIDQQTKIPEILRLLKEAPEKIRKIKKI